MNELSDINLYQIELDGFSYFFISPVFLNVTANARSINIHQKIQ